MKKIDFCDVLVATLAVLTILAAGVIIFTCTKPSTYLKDADTPPDNSIVYTEINGQIYTDVIDF